MDAWIRESSNARADLAVRTTNIGLGNPGDCGLEQDQRQSYMNTRSRKRGRLNVFISKASARKDAYETWTVEQRILLRRKDSESNRVLP